LVDDVVLYLFVVVLRLWWLKRWRGEGRKTIMTQKNKGRADFSPTLTLDFSLLGV